GGRFHEPRRSESARPGANHGGWRRARAWAGPFAPPAGPGDHALGAAGAPVPWAVALSLGGPSWGGGGPRSPPPPPSPSPTHRPPERAAPHALPQPGTVGHADGITARAGGGRSRGGPGPATTRRARLDLSPH